MLKKTTVILSFLLLFSNSSFAATVECRLSTSGSGVLKVGSKTKSVAVVKSQFTSDLQKLTSKISALKAQLKNLSLKASKRKSLILSLQESSNKARILKLSLKGVTKCARATFSSLPAGMITVIEADTFSLPAGQTISIPFGLRIEASGPVTVDGTLLASGTNGQAIEIKSNQSVTVSGQVVAGSGAVPSLKQSSSGLTGRGGSGLPGGSITITSPLIVIGQTASLVSGSGSSGYSVVATAKGSSSRARASVKKEDLEVFGGNGADGGDVILDAGTGIIRITPNEDRTPLITLGNGGEGGTATATVKKDPSGLKNLMAQGGRGGNSGAPRFAASSVEGLTYSSTIPVTNNIVMPGYGTLLNGGTIFALDQKSSNIFAGGRGGSAGDAINGEDPGLFLSSARSFSSASNNLVENYLKKFEFRKDDPACPKPNGTAGKACTPPVGTYGGDGFFCPGNGSDVYCVDPRRAGTGTTNGGVATVVAGDGGRLKVLFGLSTTLIAGEHAEFGVGFTISSIPGLRSGQGGCGGVGGYGGIALAVAGDGGPQGGSGGSATATGGKGGNAPHGAPGLDFSLTLNSGGHGGNATARAGHGQNGVSCCSTKGPSSDGQNGGTGGDGVAVGGVGGDGVIANYGGSAFAAGGNAGKGGDGDGPGSPGQVGQVHANIGAQGDGTFGPTTEAQIFPVPSKSETEGKASVAGNVCPGSDGGGGVVITPTPTPVPSSCIQGQYSGNSGCNFGFLRLFNGNSLSGSSNIEIGTTNGTNGQQTRSCISTTDCTCSISGLTINSVPNHTCCLNCTNAKVVVVCRNEIGGICTEIFTVQ